MEMLLKYRNRNGSVDEKLTVVNDMHNNQKSCFQGKCLDFRIGLAERWYEVTNTARRSGSQI